MDYPDAHPIPSPEFISCHLVLLPPLAPICLPLRLLLDFPVSTSFLFFFLLGAVFCTSAPEEILCLARPALSLQHPVLVQGEPAQLSLSQWSLFWPYCTPRAPYCTITTAAAAATTTTLLFVCFLPVNQVISEEAPATTLGSHRTSTRFMITHGFPAAPMCQYAA